MSESKTLDDKSVLLVVGFHRLGNTRKVSTGLIDVDADKSMLHVNKNLLDAREYDAIKRHDGKTRAWLTTRALPSMFKEGVFRVPNTLIVEVDEYLTERVKERAVLVEAFRKSYVKRVTEALARLNGLANVNDYLTADDAAEKFNLSWRYVTFSTPDALKNLREGLFQREREKLASEVASAAEEIKQVLRVQMAALVKRMVTQLTPSVDGKKKKIYDSLVGNVADFLATFDARNLADDGELKSLVGKARNAIAGVSPELLRESDGIRESVKTGFDEIQKQLDTMIVDKPARVFDFNGEVE
jgi:hypothetical protein